MEISQEEKERAVFRSRKMYQTDLLSDLATAEDRGEKRGEQRGIKKSKLEIARNALEMNMSIADISRLTGLSFDEITILQKQQ